jgi:hypothetical protein
MKMKINFKTNFLSGLKGEIVQHLSDCRGQSVHGHNMLLDN